MTQEDKELSFIDISGRLHYGVIVNYKESEYEHPKWKITSLHVLSYNKNGTLIDTDIDGWIGYEEYIGCGMSAGSRPFRFGEVLPYLRSMSSMTEKEKKEYELLANRCITSSVGFVHFEAQELIEWLTKNMFDYLGLIPKGLALEAPNDMYVTSKENKENEIELSFDSFYSDNPNVELIDYE